MDIEERILEEGMKRIREACKNGPIGKGEAIKTLCLGIKINHDMGNEILRSFERNGEIKSKSGKINLNE